MMKSQFNNTYIPYLLITFSVIFLYFPTLNNGFFNIDDEKVVLNNINIREFSWKNLKKNFNPLDITKHSEKAYKPLRTASYMIDYALGKNNPFIYHLGNLAIYLVICLLLYKILLEHLKNSALWISLFFALHPVHAESVAWVSARSDLLAWLFCALSFLFYQRNSNKEKNLTYIASLVFWILAFLSKSAAVTFPLPIIGYDICLKRQSWKKNLTRWAPFLILFALGGFFSIYRAEISGHIEDRLFLSSGSILYAVLLTQRYLLTGFAPFQLSFYYNPFPDLSELLPELLLSVFLCLFLVVLGLLWWFRDKKKLFILILFFIFLLPVLQLIPFPVMQADRFLFVSVLAIAITIGWSIEALKKQYYPKLSIILGFILLSLYFSLSWQRVQLWESSASIWEDALSKSSAPFAREQLGRAYFKEARYKKALDNFLKISEERPNYYGGFYWAGRSLMGLERLNEADFFLKKSKDISPNNTHIYYQLGLIALWQENLDSAENYLQKAIAIGPQFWEGYYLLGLILERLGKQDLALKKFCESLHPSNKKYNEAFIKVKQSKTGECHD